VVFEQVSLQNVQSGSWRTAWRFRYSRERRGLQWSVRLRSDDMQWKVTFHPEDKYAEIVTSGKADKEGSMEMVRELISELSQKNYFRALVDHSHLESVSGSITDVYYRPKETADMGAVRTVRIAEIIRREHEEHFKFLEVVFKNRGMNMEMFFDRESALRWLLQ
jgi:hypothetical protein